jgi:predicted Holliday junction resolvase-like endonuclease
VVPVGIPVAGLVALLLMLAAAFILVAKALLWRLDAAEQRVQAAEHRAAQAPKLSRAVTLGKIGEQVAALLPGFRYDVKDVQWVGGKVDAIVWSGLEAARCGTGPAEDIEVVLLEVKTGKYARAGEDQRLIRDAIKAGRVRFDVFRPVLEPPVRPGDAAADSGPVPLGDNAELAVWGPGTHSVH